MKKLLIIVGVMLLSMLLFGCTYYESTIRDGDKYIVTGNHGFIGWFNRPAIYECPVEKKDGWLECKQIY